VAGARWMLLFCGLSLWAPSGALAGTVVSGDRDSNAPLVIDPASSPTDPYVKEVDLATPQTLLFVQRMPVTKVVDEVTLGDLGLGSGCATPSRTRLYVREHPTGALGSSTQVAYSPGYVALPSIPGSVGYSIPATPFRKGRGYSFLLQADYSGSDCKVAKQWTWQHDGQVNGGPAGCAAAPVFQRMWHVNGIDDAQTLCVTRPPGSRAFDASMPSGWLVVKPGSTYTDVMTGTYSTGAPDSSACTTASPENPRTLGASPVFWRYPPGSTITKEYVCLWSQFAAPGADLLNGWYYALSWLTAKGGAPRDMYLRLDTVDYDALLQAHVPTLAYDAAENFYPQDAAALTDFADSPLGGYNLSSDYVNTLFAENGDELAAAGSPGPANGPWPPPLVLGTLGARYWFGPDPADQPMAASTDYIDARGSDESTYLADSASQYARGYDDVIYGRVVHDPDDGQLWLQYWVFYYFNSFDTGGIGYHEGDWEMVQVGVTTSGVPEKVTLAAHNGGYKVPWAEIPKAGLHSTSPVVHVAARSHAAYPDAGETNIVGFVAVDAHRGDGVWKTLPLEAIDSTTRWTSWPGRWGSSPGSAAAPSPPNPSEHSKWTHPSAFHASAATW
jgi:hypothetical protein